MYKQILLSYDGSLEGLLALREGALLAKQSSARVFLLCIVPITPGALIAESAHGGVMAAHNLEYRALLQRAVDRLNELGFEPTSRFVEGEPTPTIAAVAKEIAADLVVVGHRSERFLSRWWSGSKQSYLTEYVKCSVLIARNALTDEEFEAEYRKLDAMGYGNEGAR